MKGGDHILIPTQTLPPFTGCLESDPHLQFHNRDGLTQSRVVGSGTATSATRNGATSSTMTRRPMSTMSKAKGLGKPDSDEPAWDANLTNMQLRARLRGIP